ncbi:MAG: NADP-dependent malic enzyme [Nanoarchaeota archaeon]|nr:NADP-dependent malic enzyme [Nanoarchaeota archaeon]
MDYATASAKLHQEQQGKIATALKVPLETKEDLSLAYTPGVAQPCKIIAQDKKEAYNYTLKANTVAVITDGSAVLGLGNIGPEASIPVMEGKSALFKRFAGLNSFPIAINTQDVEEFIETVKRISPVFGGINLEDISAPRCFEIERRLKEELDIPVFHDDQHGTAIVVLAGIINSLKLTEKKEEDLKAVVMGSGAAGTAITKLLLSYGIKNVISVDRQGALYQGREEMNPVKEKLAALTNPHQEKGMLTDIIKGADIFIGVSAPNVLTQEMIKTMNERPIIFALANPDPEITPQDAKEAGAYIIATGRSDYPNQINNVLVFPGIFKGALLARARNITEDMKLAAAKALASCVDTPTPEKIIPGVFDTNTADIIAEAVKACEAGNCPN